MVLLQKRARKEAPGPMPNAFIHLDYKKGGKAVAAPDRGIMGRLLATIWSPDEGMTSEISDSWNQTCL